MVTTRKTRAVVTSASHRRPQWEPESPVKKFYKLVLPSTMKTKMMRIPPGFVELHGSRLSEVVTLETCVGFKRSIKLKRIGKEIWFQEGWNEFAEAHSIDSGYFLHFEYKGNSTFRVTICDRSAAEIKYPLDTIDISDSDDEIIEVTDKEFVGFQGTMDNADSVNGELKKLPRDIEFENHLNDVDRIINSIEVLNSEDIDTRVFRGKQSF